MAKTIALTVGEAVRRIEMGPTEGDSLRLSLDGVEHVVELHQIGEGPIYELVIDHQATELLIRRDGRGLTVIIGADAFSVERYRPGVGTTATERLEAGEVIIRSPMTGMVVEVLVQAGDSVAKGDALLVVQAMKMNNEIRSPAAGVVVAVAVSVNQAVEQGAPLLTLHLGGEAQVG